LYCKEILPGVGKIDLALPPLPVGERIEVRGIFFFSMVFLIIS